MVRSLHKLITGMNVVVILGFELILCSVLFPELNDCTAYIANDFLNFL